MQSIALPALAAARGQLAQRVGKTMIQVHMLAGFGLMFYHLQTFAVCMTRVQIRLFLTLW